MTTLQWAENLEPWTLWTNWIAKKTKRSGRWTWPPCVVAAWRILFRRLSHPVKFSLTQYSAQPIKNKTTLAWPSHADSAFFPSAIRSQIEERATHQVRIDFTCSSLLKSGFPPTAAIQVHLIGVSAKKTAKKVWMCRVAQMAHWFQVASSYMTPDSPCSKELTLFWYDFTFDKTHAKKKTTKTKAKKKGEEEEKEKEEEEEGGGLKPFHVNTAFASSCPAHGSQIVMYRNEEWFKVLIHESFHALGLDFSMMPSDELLPFLQQEMRRTFVMESDFLMFETWAEIWAEVLQVAFACFYVHGNQDFLTSSFSSSSLSAKMKSLFVTKGGRGGEKERAKEKEKEKEDKKQETQFRSFLSSLSWMLEMEKSHALHQMVYVLREWNEATLDHLLVSSFPASFVHSRTRSSLVTPYQESTNVFAYYVAKAVCFYQLPSFLEWSVGANGGTQWFAFQASWSNVRRFCQWIRVHAMDEDLLGLCRAIDTLQQTRMGSVHSLYGIPSLRMSLFEFDMLFSLFSPKSEEKEQEAEGNKQKVAVIDI